MNRVLKTVAKALAVMAISAGSALLAAHAQQVDAIYKVGTVDGIESKQNRVIIDDRVYDIRAKVGAGALRRGVRVNFGYVPSPDGSSAGVIVTVGPAPKTGN